MKDKYKYILYILLFISVAVILLFGIKFYQQFMKPNVEAEMIQKNQITMLAELNAEKDRQLTQLENTKNQEIIETIVQTKIEKDAEYKNSIDQLNSEISSLLDEVALYVTKIENLESSNNQEINAITESYSIEIVQLKNQIDNYKVEITNVTKQYTSEQNQLIQTYEEKIQKIENDNRLLNSEVTQIKTVYEEEIKELEGSYKEYADQLLGDITLQIEDNKILKEQFIQIENEIISLKETYNGKILDLQAQLVLYEDDIDERYLLSDRRYIEAKDEYKVAVNNLQETINWYESSNEIGLLKAAYEENILQLENQLMTVTEGSSVKINSLELEVLSYKNKLNELLEGSVEESLSVKNSYEEKIEQLNEIIIGFENENSKLLVDVKEKTETISNLNDSYKEEIAILNETYVNKIKVIENNNKEQIIELNDNNQQKIDEITVELNQFKISYDEYKIQQKSEFDVLTLTYNEQLVANEKLKRAQELAVSNMKIEYEGLLSELSDDLNLQINLLNNEVENYRQQVILANSLLDEEVEEINLTYQETISSLKLEIVNYYEEMNLLEQNKFFESQANINSYINEIKRLNNIIITYEAKISDLELNSSIITVTTTQNDEKKVVYLTFDDGPSQMTIPILNILDKYQIKATFFVIYRDGYEYEYKQIYDRGHTIGNHTYSHDYSYIYADVDNFYEDAKRLDDYIYDLTKSTTLIMRFPGGTNSSWAGNDIKMQILDESSKRGYIYFDWNASAGDGAPTMYSEEDIFKNATKTFDSVNDVYLLMHDSKSTYSTVDALDNLIEFYLENGYEFLPITFETPQCKMYNAE